MNLNPYRFVPGDPLGIELKDRPMTVAELAAKLEADAKLHPNRGVRKRATPQRCLRVANRAIANRDASAPVLASMCAAEERGQVYQSEGYGFAWLALLLPILQMLFQFLAQKAIEHLTNEQTSAPASKGVIQQDASRLDEKRGRNPSEPGFGFHAWDKSEPY